MKLKRVRVLKAQLLKDLVAIEVAENDAIEAEFNEYADRLVDLMNKIEKGSDFCISFIPDGETKRVNVLPPTRELGVAVLQDLALGAILTRLERRAERDDKDIVVAMELVPTKED